MKIAVVGYETEGRVSYEYFAKRGHDVTICDVQADKAIPEGASAQLGAEYLRDLDQFDLIVRSAGINPHIILEANPTVVDKITTAVNEFLAVCPTQNVIGITGTKGKGTTSTLTTLMLRAAGKRVHLGGNIGCSPLEFIDKIQPDDWVVLELSSYQLCDIKHSPHIAACLMMEPEHLPWHGDMLAYTEAKAQLFRWQTEQDLSIYFAENAISQEIAASGPGVMIPYYAEPGALVHGEHLAIQGHTICKTDEVKLLGTHNWQNICAAATITWQVAQDVDAIRSIATTFAGLPHRLEFVREVNGIAFYNDSFASAPPAPAAAMQAIPQPKVLILGGYDRTLPLETLAQAVKAHERDLRAVIVIGQSGPRLMDALQAVGFPYALHSPAQSMPEIVAEALKVAQPGDAILLSPGFASFDMFKNFEERGELFKQVVNAL